MLDTEWCENAYFQDIAMAMMDMDACLIAVGIKEEELDDWNLDEEFIQRNDIKRLPREYASHINLALFPGKKYKIQVKLAS